MCTDNDFRCNITGCLTKCSAVGIKGKANFSFSCLLCHRDSYSIVLSFAFYHWIIRVGQTDFTKPFCCFSTSHCFRISLLFRLPRWSDLLFLLSYCMSITVYLWALECSLATSCHTPVNWLVIITLY